MTRRTLEAAERRMWRDAFCAVFAAYDAGQSAAQADLALTEFRKRYTATDGEQENESPNWNALKALRCCVDALVDLREAVKTAPALNHSRYDALGVAVNRAIDAGIAALRAYPQDAPVQSPGNQEEPNPGTKGGQS